MDGNWKVRCRHPVYNRKKIILAAGTIASTRLVLKALEFYEEVPLYSCPMAAFLLWQPSFLGKKGERGYSMGQLSFSAISKDSIPVFGSLFNIEGIPISEFVQHSPFRRRFSIDILRELLTSCVAGNLFLPGRLSAAKVRLTLDGTLLVKGDRNDGLEDIMKTMKGMLRYAFRRLGLVMVPASFTIGEPGGDIHYAGTMPMRMKPVRGETDMWGGVQGLPDLHVVDGSVLPVLSEKPHTLTIMANADRIAKYVAGKLKGRKESDHQ